ncbi:unnamed protein product [Paramecium sonneborni]|uniref:Meckelin n=1 Tax=Paramecium sonneborni TaxID=65129 RepID=A0A8S1M2Y1_9CILI|nr:unnamed protein product [Paramecium sonneborni]
MLFILFIIQSINAQKCETTDQFYNPLSSKCETCPTGTGLINNQCICDSTINGVPINQVCAAETNLCISDTGSWQSSACQCSGHAISLPTNICQQCPNNLINVQGKCSCSGSTTSSDNYCVTQYLNVFQDDIAQIIGPKAYDGCIIYNDMVSCQQLANLFILKRSTLSTERDFNYLYNAVLTSQNKKNMPKIIHEVSTTVTSVTLIEDTPLQMQVNFKEDRTSSLNKLQFYVIEYYIDGSVSELKPLQNQFQLCSSSYGDTDLASHFGVSYRNDCNLDFTKYLENNYKTVFYSIWIKDIDGSFIQIPIKIAGYDGNGSGEAETDYGYANTKFLWRFFMVDNLKSPSEIIYAQTIRLISYLSTKEEDKTFLPYFYVIYSDPITITNIQTEKYYPVFYRHNYYQAQTSFYTVATALLIVAHVLIIIIWFIRIYIWSKRNPSYTGQNDWCMYLTIKSFYVLLDTWAEVIFYYLAIFTGYLFCFYKFQQTIYILMPPLSDYENNYRPFEILFFMMFACRLISMFNLILRQADVQVFFVDWEKSEVLRPRELADKLDNNVLKMVESAQTKQSAWRMILIANEFNELQVYRIVSVEWTLLFVGFFLEGLKWINLDQEQPNLKLERIIPKNYVIQYFLCAFLYMTIGLAQIIIQKLFDIWFPILVEDFVDLCAISNVSILILDDVLHGYYIHGENPVGYAEGSSEHLANCLHYEALGKGKKRGFIQESSQQHQDDVDLQTFELFLPMRFRDAYEKVYNQELKQKTDNAQYQNYNEIRILRQGVPDGLDMALVQTIKDTFSFYLKDVLTQVRTNFSKCVRDKLPVQRFFDYPPADLEENYFKDQSMPVFFRDPDQSFKTMFFCGHEYFFLITDTMIFNFWMILTDNTYLSLMLTYLISAGIFNFRQWVGERNLADQSKIDSRFLI